MHQLQWRPFRSISYSPALSGLASESTSARPSGPLKDRSSRSSRDSLDIYLSQMGKIPRLAREGDIGVAFRIQEARRSYRSKILESPVGVLEAIRVLEHLRNTHRLGDEMLEDTSSIDPDRPGILGRLPRLIAALRSSVDI